MTETVTKFQAAEQQLIAAIDLYFEGKNPIATHTLVRAAYEILDRLCLHRGLERSVISQGENLIKPELKKAFFKKISEARNFFKHAATDPEATIEWNPELSATYIWDATALYRRLTEGKESPCEILVFSVWFRVVNHELWEVPSVLDAFIPDAITELNTIGKLEAYQFLLKQCKDRANKPIV